MCGGVSELVSGAHDSWKKCMYVCTVLEARTFSCSDSIASRSCFSASCAQRWRRCITSACRNVDVRGTPRCSSRFHEDSTASELAILDSRAFKAVSCASPSRTCVSSAIGNEAFARSASRSLRAEHADIEAYKLVHSSCSEARRSCSRSGPRYESCRAFFSCCTSTAFSSHTIWAPNRSLIRYAGLLARAGLLCAFLYIYRSRAHTLTLTSTPRHAFSQNSLSLSHSLSLLSLSLCL